MDVNEIRVACEKCMAERGRYVFERNLAWFRGQCNICQREKVLTWVEAYTERHIGWERV